MIFYAPARGLREVRDRAPLAAMALVALLAHGLFFVCIALLNLGYLVNARSPFVIFSLLLQAAGSLVIVARRFLSRSLCSFRTCLIVAQVFVCACNRITLR